MSDSPRLPNDVHEVIDRLIAREGGLVDDPDDPGGLTKYGISQRSYPDLDIRNLTAPVAATIYYTDYYLKAGLYKIPLAHAEPVLDMCVNAGIGPAVKLAQKAANTQADGVIGPSTVSAFLGIHHTTFRRRYCLERLLHYVFIILRRPTSVKYARGWFNRTLDLL
jgi:lysozyme family protein